MARGALIAPPGTSGGETAEARAGRDVVEALRAKTLAVLGGLVPRHASCALLGFPDYGNVGDSAIWLGEAAALRALDARVAYACDARTYSAAALRARLPAGVILLTGGGNLGDLWERHQRFREQVIEAFPHLPVVQLPQTIHFRSPANLDRARRVFRAHPDFTLLARDRRSLEVAERELGVRTALCPDMALALGRLDRPRRARAGVVALARSDVESAADLRRAIGDRVWCTDWIDDVDTLATRATERLRTLARRHPRGFGALHRAVWLGYPRIAPDRGRRGGRILSGGRVVITDRLHGHILSLMLGIPHVVLDNSYGKVRAFFETWTHSCGLARWADSPAHGLELARRLALEDSLGGSR